MIRLFLALPPSEEEARLLWDQWETFRFSSPRVRWIPADQFHVTLIFLGSLERTEIPVICDLMDDVSRLYAPFKLRTDGPGQFPGHGSPRVLIEHLSDSGFASAGQLGSLQHLLYQELKNRYSLEKRTFRPHITTARVQKHFAGPVLPLVPSGFRNITLSFDKLVLFESVLKPDAAVYNTVYDVNFEG